jgi:hypothetical protein
VFEAEPPRTTIDSLQERLSSLEAQLSRFGRDLDDVTEDLTTKSGRLLDLERYAARLRLECFLCRAESQMYAKLSPLSLKSADKGLRECLHYVLEVSDDYHRRIADSARPLEDVEEYIAWCREYCASAGSPLR